MMGSKNQMASKRISIVIADAGLELIPKEMHTEKVVINQSNKNKKKPSELILDVSYHYNIMKSNNLKEIWKRGRPDIAHLALLTMLSSPLYKRGESDIYIHTRNNQVIFLNPGLQVRIPKSYSRFEGLITKLLLEKIIIVEKKGIVYNKDNDYLLKVENNMTFESLKKMINPEITIGFSSRGVKKTFTEVVTQSFMRNNNKISNNNILFVIGGFQHGHFSSDIEKFFDSIFCISSFNLEAHVVLSRLIYEMEKVMNIF